MVVLLSMLTMADAGPTFCTEMGCYSRAKVTFKGATWDDAKPVTITITENGSTHSCTGHPNALTCDETVQFEAGPLGRPASMAVRTKADALTVTVTSGAKTLAKKTFDTTETRFYPNGKDCGPMCINFEGNLSWSSGDLGPGAALHERLE